MTDQVDNEEKYYLVGFRMLADDLPAKMDDDAVTEEERKNLWNNAVDNFRKNKLPPLVQEAVSLIKQFNKAAAPVVVDRKGVTAVFFAASNPALIDSLKKNPAVIVEELDNKEDYKCLLQNYQNNPAFG